jgi:hypothetical protein
MSAFESEGIAALDSSEGGSEKEDRRRRIGEGGSEKEDRRRKIGEDGCTLLERLDGIFSTSTLLIEAFEAWRRMTFRSSPLVL